MLETTVNSVLKTIEYVPETLLVCKMYSFIAKFVARFTGVNLVNSGCGEQVCMVYYGVQEQYMESSAIILQVRTKWSMVFEFCRKHNRQG